tara:strand:+ start:210 stop:707 length:498 start_codon:yes stop_codon:yes gene_type:complete
MEKTVYFVDADQALYWLMEQKRQQANINTSNIETLDEQPSTRELTVTELLKWSGVYQFPKGKEEISMVLGQLEKVFLTLDKRTQVILMLIYLGDFATPQMLEKAKSMQKTLRDRGYKVVLNYKYKKIKVADMLKIDRKTVTRHVQKANKSLTDNLLDKGFIIDQM